MGQLIHRASKTMSGGSRVPVTMRDFFFDDPFFKNTWEDFDRVREAMFTESREKWMKFDEDFRNMACMSNNIMLESSGDTETKSETPALAADPRALVRQDFPNNMEIFKTKDSEVIRVKEDESKLEVSLDT